MGFGLRQIFNETGRRGVLKAGGIYLASAWGLIQVADIMLPSFGLPLWVFELLIWLVVIGFPFTLAFSWRYNVTLDGISLTPPLQASEAESLRLRKRDFAALVFMAVFLVLLTYFLVDLLRKQQFESMENAEEQLEIPRQSIAVLPFDNLSGDPDQSHLGNAFTIEITTELSRFNNLFVIGSHSVFNIEESNKSATELSRELGVRYLMSGSVQIDAGRLRVNVQLMDAFTGRNVWAERFDKRAIDLPAVENELIAAVVASLALQISADERRRAMKKDVTSLEARDYYLRGVASQPCESSSECRDNFEKAYALDPNHSRTLSWLSYVLQKGYAEGWEGYSKNELFRALELAKRAVELEPEDYQGYWSLAMVYITLRDFTKGMAAYNRALLLNDNDPDLLVEMAEQLVYEGRHEEALEQIQIGMRLNPIFPDWYLHDLGWVLYFLKDYERSIEVVGQMIKRPRNVHALMAANYAQLGDHAQAAREIDEYLKRRPGWTISNEREREFFRDAQSEQHWLSGLREAGLPE